MKKTRLVLFLFFLVTSCSTTYQYYQTTGTTPIHGDEVSTIVQGTIPPGEIIIAKGKKGKRNYVQYFHGSYAWLSLDQCIYQGKATAEAFQTVIQPSASSTPSGSSSGGSVLVKGYYRKDSTYVQPHTRKAPRRRG